MKNSDRAEWYRSTFLAVTLLALTAMLAVAPQRAGAVCAGDCDASTSVSVGELITLVNIALGNVAATACTQGIPSGGAVTISLIVQAVNSALHGCGMTGGRLCGNGVPDAGEDCDNGGTCIGGTNAGTPCQGDGQCQGDGVCLDGPKANFGCSSDADCAGSTCIRCKTFGGKGCAANCTTESDVEVPLVPGQNPPGDPASLVSGTSGLVVNSPGINVGIPIPPNLTRHLTIGKNTDGKIPYVLKAAMNQTPGIDVLMGMACICLRPVGLKTCGGTLWEKDGQPSTDCTPGYTSGACPATKPCTFAYGPDNVGTGEIGCDSLNGLNVMTTRDSGGSSGTAGPILTTLSDSGGAGSGVAFLSTELGFILTTCTGTDETMYGKDHMFCTDDDPQSARGAILPQVLTTGSASASVFNANATDPSCSITSTTTCHVDGDCPSGETCAPNTIGPSSAQGHPFSCSALTGNPPSASQAALAGAFPDLGAPVIGDIVVTDVQVGQ